MDAWKGAAGGCGAGFDSLVGTVKIIPGKALDVGAQDQIRMTLPDFELMFLCGADGTAHDLKYVGWGAALSILEANGNTYDVGGTKFARGLRGDLGDEAAISEAARPDLYGFEQAWESAACADCFTQISVGENDGLAVSKIGCNHGHGNLKVFKTTRLENLLNQVAEAVIASQSKPRDSPPGDIAEAKCAAGSNDAREWRAAGVGRTEDATNTGAGDKRYWYSILLKDLENPEMCEPPSETPAQSEANSRSCGLGAWPSVLQ